LGRIRRPLRPDVYHRLLAGGTSMGGPAPANPIRPPSGGSRGAGVDHGVAEGQVGLVTSCQPNLEFAGCHRPLQTAGTDPGRGWTGSNPSGPGVGTGPRLPARAGPGPLAGATESMRFEGAPAGQNNRVALRPMLPGKSFWPPFARSGFRGPKRAAVRRRACRHPIPPAYTPSIGFLFRGGIRARLNRSMAFGASRPIRMLGLRRSGIGQKRSAQGSGAPRGGPGD